MKKTLTMTAMIAAAVMTLSACTDSGTTSADPNSDPGADATGLSEEQAAAIDEVNPQDIPEHSITLSSLHGHEITSRHIPSSIGVLCIDEHAFLHTRDSARIDSGTSTARYPERDSDCGTDNTTTQDR